MTETFLNGKVTLWAGDCLDVLARLEECSVDSVVCDPPYHLTSIVKRFSADGAAPAKVGKTGAYARASAGFMGKQWDGGDIAFQPETWAAVLRVLKPGGHLIAFAGTRTYHRMVCAIEDAGFEIRDQIGWAYGSGFPKSHDVSKGIDRAAGVDREDKFEGSFERRAGPTGNRKCDACGKWLISGSPCKCPRPQDAAITEDAIRWQGWGTALKPAWEPICLARKPLIGTVAENVQQWGTGALNIDGCRVGTAPEQRTRHNGTRQDASSINMAMEPVSLPAAAARWPANIVHDGSDEVVKAFPICDSARASGNPNNPKRGENHVATSYGQGNGQETIDYRDTGSAARFFYTAKADSDDRIGSRHPTVKPIDLMQWLVRLVTPKNGVCLDPFAGTGTTGEACFREGMRAVLIEREEEYQADIRRRMALVLAGPDERQHASIKASGKTADAGPLFASEWDTMWKEPWVPAAE